MAPSTSKKDPRSIQLSNKKGFTLIEITVVIVIIGILAAIAIPNYITFVGQGMTQNAENNLQAISNAQKIYYLNHGKYCAVQMAQPIDMVPCSSLSLINTALSLNINDNNFYYICSEGLNVPPVYCQALRLNVSGDFNSDLITALSVWIPSPPGILPAQLCGGQYCPANTSFVNR